MKAVYSFKKEFEIDGHEFELDMRTFKSDNLMAVSKKFTAASEQVGKEQADIKLIISLYKEAIEYILGEGAFDKIFGETGATPRACNNLLEFLTGELKKEFGLAEK